MQMGQELTLEQRLDRLETSIARICWELDCIAHAVKALLEANKRQHEAEKFIEDFYSGRGLEKNDDEPPPTRP